jgi:hypothetical protein
MLTHRDYDRNLTKFKSHISLVKEELEKNGISFDKVEIEECVADTNVDIDNEWLNS